MKRNRFLGFLIAFSMLISVLPTYVYAAAAGTVFTAGDFNYKVNAGNAV